MRELLAAPTLLFSVEDDHDDDGDNDADNDKAPTVAFLEMICSTFRGEITWNSAAFGTAQRRARHCLSLRENGNAGVLLFIIMMMIDVVCVCMSCCLCLYEL